MGEGFGFISDDEDRALLMRAKDLLSSAEKWGKACFSHFLTEHQQAVIEQQLKGSRFCFFGGFEGAQRRIFCAPPSNLGHLPGPGDYPLRAVTMLFPKGYGVAHRDILGSLMALKLKREAIGDILAGEGLAVVFLLESAAGLVLGELDRVGGVGVKCSPGAPEELPEPYRLERREGVVSSMRADAIISLLAGLSRSESARMISQGLAMKNSMAISSPSKEIAEGDKLSLRGYGKFQIESIGGVTRKGRLRVIYNKFI